MTMTTLQPKNTFARMGFALVAGSIASVLASLFVLAPIATQENLQKLIELIGPSLVLLLTYIPQIAVLLVFCLFVMHMPKEDREKESMSFRTLFRIFMMMYAVSSVLQLIGQVISRAAPAGGTEQLDLLGSIVSTKLLGGILIPVLLAPVVEELIFRKLMLDRIRMYGEKNAILFSALCFGLFHGNLTQFLFAFSVGLFLGYVYCKTGKVLYTMIMHILLNALSTSLLLIVPLFASDNSASKALAAVAGILLLLFIAFMVVDGVILLIRKIKSREIRLDNSMQSCIPQGEILKTVYLNIGVILFFVLSFVSIVTGLLNISLPF